MKAAILEHGLEGNSRRQYVMGMARAMLRRDWDCAAMNFRGCSGKPNRRLCFYHHGKTDDLHAVVSHVVSSGGYRTVALIGFSLGAAM